MRTFSLARQWHREAWSLLRGPLKWWFLPAAALTLALSALGWWGISALALSVADVALAWVAPEHEVGWAHAALEWLVWLVLLAVKLKLTKYIVLVVMGPLFAAVSEAVEAQIHGHTVPFSLRRWIRDTLRGMRSAVWLALFEWTTVALLWVVGLLVPVLSPFTLTLAWLVGAWAYGASVMDYVWERQGKGGAFRLAIVAPTHGRGARLRRAVFALDVHPRVGLDGRTLDGRDGSHRRGIRGLDRS